MNTYIMYIQEHIMKNRIIKGHYQTISQCFVHNEKTKISIIIVNIKGMKLINTSLCNWLDLWNKKMMYKSYYSPCICYTWVWYKKISHCDYLCVLIIIALLFIKGYNWVYYLVICKYRIGSYYIVVDYQSSLWPVSVSGLFIICGLSVFYLCVKQTLFTLMSWV